MSPDKMERATGCHFPHQTETNLKFRRLSVEELLTLGSFAEFDGVGWGSQINNPCHFYKSKDGRLIEVYGIESFGHPTTAFIEVKT